MNSQILKLVGEKIKKARKEAGITQNDFAAILGVSHITLKKIERGEDSVSAGTFMKAMNELGIELTFKTYSPKITVTRSKD